MSELTVESKIWLWSENVYKDDMQEDHPHHLTFVIPTSHISMRHQASSHASKHGLEG